MKPRGTVQLRAWVGKETLDRVAAISKRTGLRYGEVLAIAMKHAQDNVFMNTRGRQVSIKF